MKLVKNTFKYQVKRNGKIIFRGFTLDLKRRGAEHKARYPDCIVEQVGKKVTWQEAMQWAGGKI